MSRPTGTITFLFTDVEGSTQRWEREPASMEAAWHRQEALVRAAILTHGGYPYKLVGDAFQAAFQTAPAALAAAVAAQRALAAAPWETATPLRVRMALHTGTTEEWPDDYVGPLLNRLARLLSAGHGGQILLTLATAELVRDVLPAGVTLRDLGERRLKDLTRPEHVWQVVLEDLPTDFPPLKTLDGRPNNLPAQPNAFIGREAEIAALVERLRQPEVRLLTLTGPGGTGKTRLALQIAAELLDALPDGVWFVDLAPISDPGLVPAAIAGVLGVPEHGGVPLLETLATFLRDKHLLLVLDNFEQVPAAAPGVGRLLAAAPRLTVLVTSRVPLGLYGEQEHAVPPLALPATQPLPPPEQLTRYEAVGLFVARARAVRDDFQVTNQNAAAVAAICARLDGLPLALELAAARLRLFGPEALLARLGSRLRLLTGGTADRPARQQTLRAAIAWSYDLLSAGEQQLFRRLAVFQGGRTLEAIEAVCGGDVLDGVEALVGQSLLRAEAGPNGEPRYVLLETIHEFAWEQLAASGEAAALRREHARYFLALAQAGAAGLETAQEVTWLARLDTEYDNVRAALSWAVEAGEPATALRLAGALTHYWRPGHRLEDARFWLHDRLAPVLRVIEGAAEAGTLPAHLQVLWAEVVLATWRWIRDDPGRAQSAYERSLAIARRAGSPQAIGRALLALGSLATSWDQGYGQARHLLDEARTACRAGEDTVGEAWVLRASAQAALYHGDLRLARTAITEALGLARALGIPSLLAGATWEAGRIAHEEGRLGDAERLEQEALALGRVLGNPEQIGEALNLLGEIARLRGDYPAARIHYAEALPVFRAAGLADSITMWACASNLAFTVLRAGEVGPATALWREASRMGAGHGHPLTRAMVLIGLAAATLAARHVASAAPAVAWLAAAQAVVAASGRAWETIDRQEFDYYVAAARALLPPAEFEAAWIAGQKLSLEEALAEALAVPGDVTEDPAP